MKYQFDGYNYLVRLNKGEMLVEQLVKLASERQIKGAWISGIGGAAWAELGFYNLGSKQYQWKKIGTALEIVSLQGVTAWSDGTPVAHLHATVSDQEMKTYAGHVKDMEISGTCELFVHVWNGDQLTRSQNDEVGLKLLDL